jgi:hypothetical protein
MRPDALLTAQVLNLAVGYTLLRSSLVYWRFEEPKVAFNIHTTQMRTHIQMTKR